MLTTTPATTQPSTTTTTSTTDLVPFQQQRRRSQSLSALSRRTTPFLQQRPSNTQSLITEALQRSNSPVVIFQQTINHYHQTPQEGSLKNRQIQTQKRENTKSYISPSFYMLAITSTLFATALHTELEILKIPIKYLVEKNLIKPNIWYVQADAILPIVILLTLAVLCAFFLVASCCICIRSASRKFGITE